MGQAFYRKYRSRTLDEVVGQDHIAAVLKNSVKSGNLSHAYLFTGPRGVGKTSVARILAREVNQLGPDDSGFYSDIIEIDAASNRRIEEIRELRDKIAIAPSQLKYKVYIIDEVHMLTREAFNALLKTLEEPPAHAIFILATTDFHKVPDTITSRCMRLNFKLIPKNELTASLKKTAQIEKIDIRDEALDLIADYSGGSFRDALSLLDQMSSIGKQVDIELLELTLGIASKQSISQLVGSIAKGNTTDVFQNIQNMIDAGATPDQINKQLSAELRSILLESDSKFNTAQAIDLIDNLNGMYSYQDQRISLELAILKVIKPKNTAVSQAVESEEPANNNKTEKFEPAKVIEPLLPEPKAKISGQKNNEASKLWQEVLEKLKTENNTLYSIARMAEPSLQDGKLDLHFKFPFHMKQISLQKNKNLIEKLLEDIDNEIVLNIELSSSDKKVSVPAVKTNPGKSPDDLKSISNIFGSAEVLES